MKALIALSILLSSSITYAMPNVGDYSLLAGKGPFSVKVEAHLRITEYDSVDDAFLVHEQVFVRGRVEHDLEQWYDRDALWTEEGVDDLHHDCEELETIETDVGLFETCPVDFQNDQGPGRSWVGKVPFGAVQIHQKSQYGRVKLKLKHFEFGATSSK